jgi:choice-of-anchor B domain-containing protein
MRSTVLAFATLAIGAVPAAAQGFGGAAAVAGREAFIGQANNQYAPGLVYVYRPDAKGAWREAARLAAPDSARGDGFGRALALDGSTLLVGQSTDDSAAANNRIHVYTKPNAAGAWRHAGHFAPQQAVPGDGFGRTLAVSGDLAVVGAANSDSSRGSVYLFRRSGSSWTQQAVLRPEGLQPNAGFGSSVAIAGDLLLIGASRADSNSGAAYVFRRDSAGAWAQDAKLTLPVLPAMARNARFGASVLLHDGRAYVGAPGLLQFVGGVLAFEHDTAQKRWRPIGSYLPFEASPGTQFGTSVAVVGQDVWVGAPGAAQFNGRVYRISRDTAGHATLAQAMGPQAATEQLGFGGQLAAGAGIAIVGMPNADFGEGRAAILTRAASGNTWAQRSVTGQIFRPAAVAGREVSCAEGKAGMFGCQKVNMLSLLPVADMGGKHGTRLNDVWGWTDQDGKEYAIVGRSDGVSFVDVSNPSRPRYLGDLPKTAKSPPAVWRDMKIYKNHVFVVADGSREHGMQVFDLTRLRTVRTPQTFTPDAHYTRINSAHNIVIDTMIGTAFIVGASSGGETCGGGLHMVDISDPKSPEFQGCFQDKATGNAGTGYSHDAQCVVYHGPDTRYTGKHICIGANETAISVADVTDKKNPIAVGRGTYPNVGYAHQGWFTDDHKYFYLDDELDELQGKAGPGTRTIIWDLTKLDDPIVAGEYHAPVKASDHNLYIKGDRMYNSNYVSGLRVVDIKDRTNPKEIGYFDTVPVGTDDPGFGGSWSNFPYFKSGTILVTSGNEGLFLLKDQSTELTP